MSSFKVYQIMFFIGFFAINIQSQEFTDKCDETELSAKQKEADTCIETHKIELANILSNSEIETSLAICQNMREVLGCLMNLFESCYEENISKRVRLNFLYDQAQIALNTSQLLGKPFLQECDLFPSFQKEYIFHVTGSNKCSFVDYVKVIIPRKKDCDAKVDQEWNQKLKLSALLSGASARQFLLNIACDAYKDFIETCRQPLIDQCFSQEEGQNLIDRDYKKVFSVYETSIQKIDSSFTYEGSCSNLQIENDFSAKDFFVPSRRSISKRSASYFKSARDYLYSDEL
ncbi:uncharacterized protein [Lepeophtheirus salmonis]|uniref:uncharacterized protein n=1 Tax=Lepeophtheirus salmonis TaxID=72036 RepID=UPI001AEA4C85|nr:uncharacterized protein LOC121124597 [Lepeophtheirus salmonis]